MLFQDVDLGGPSNNVLDAVQNRHATGNFEEDNLGLFLQAAEHCSQWNWRQDAKVQEELGKRKDGVICDKHRTWKWIVV